MKDSLRWHPLAAAGACAVVALALPAPALAAMTIGADLSGTPGTTVTCSPSSACDLSQLQTAGTNEVAPFDGVVVRWRVKGFSGPMKLRVIRPFGGSSFTFVSSGAVVSPPTTGVETFPAQLPVKLGDYVGVELTSASSTFAFDSAGTHPGDKVAVWTGANLDGTTNMATFGDGTRLYMNADVEPDADHDGFGDETQDACPGVAGPDNGCPPPPVAPPPDNTAPVVTASGGSSRLARRGTVSFFLTANENSSGTVGATVSVPANAKVLRFRNRKVTLAASIKTKVTLKLSRKDAARVRRVLKKKRLTVKVTATVKDAAGNTTTKRLRLKLKR